MLVNCYRGSSVLTNKSALLKTMRLCAVEHGMMMMMQPATEMYWMPTTFILRPDGFNDERAMFLAEYERLHQLALTPSSSPASSAPSSSADSSINNAWIVKANRGAKGSDILVSDDADRLIAFVDARVKNSNKSGKNDGSPVECAASPSSSLSAAAALPTHHHHHLQLHQCSSYMMIARTQLVADARSLAHRITVVRASHLLSSFCVFNSRI